MPLSNLLNHRICKGAWFIDADHSLPSRQPTASQLRAYAAAKRTWDKKQKAAKLYEEKLLKDARRCGFLLGIDEGGVQPVEEPPVKPFPAEYVKTDLDRAVAEYRMTGSEEALRRVVGLGCRIVYGIGGSSVMSLGRYPPTDEEFRRDGPPVPAGISVERAW